ncbi:MAG: T9SS type A sorting domain-containing protein [Flavobacteriales bacterium]|nr:T9SS type A sorting domain-containing protein [Flavobacteriales bacterium]
MKKILLSILMLAAAGAASAQCTPDPSVNSGISPDTLTGMDVAYTGQPYSQVFTFVVPADTTWNGASVTIDHVQLDDVTGLPSNFDYICNPSSCNFPGGTKKCVELVSTSDPTVSQIGTYPVTILATGYIIAPPFINTPTSVGQTTYDGYYLVIADGATQVVEQVSKGEMRSLIAYPNPTNGNTTIEYAMGYTSEVTFTVTNLLGEVVNKQVLSASKGLNRVLFDASNVNNGVYIYTITDGKNTISKKLIVNK